MTEDVAEQSLSDRLARVQENLRGLLNRATDPAAVEALEAAAHEIGMVSAVYPRAELLDKAKEMLRKVTKNGPVAVRMALESIYRALDTSTQEALDYESTLFGLLASTEDMEEGMSAFLEKRKADFKGR